MILQLEPVNAEGRARFRCDECGLVTTPLRPEYVHKLSCRCPRKTPVPPGLIQHVRESIPKSAGRPGIELKSVLAELGIRSFQGCGCGSKVAQMDRWGIAGCREHFDEIRTWLIEAQAKASWFDKIRAGVNAARIGLPIDLTDIAGSLVRIAIERAEASQTMAHPLQAVHPLP